MHPQNQTRQSQHSHFPFLINKNKKISSSSFHTHFNLINVKWKSKSTRKQQKLIQYVIQVLNNYCKINKVHISSITDDETYNLSIVLFDDMEAFHFINKKQPITLSDCTNTYKYYPVISNEFQSYMNRLQFERTLAYMSSQNNFQNQDKQQKNKIISQHEQQQIRKYKMDEGDQSYKINYHQYNEREKDKEKEKVAYCKVNKIWAFGIPKQFQIQQIRSSLKNYKLQVNRCRWKLKQPMQYLQIQLMNQIQKNTIYSLGLQIQGYPYVVIPVVESNKITRQLSRYTVQIIVKQSQDDQYKFMEAMNQIGGVNIMLRTPIKQKKQYRYIVVFNSVGNAELACRVAKNLRNCITNHKQYQLKLGRLCKFYTFTELMRQHLLDQ